jgi:hypothetical protein
MIPKFLLFLLLPLFFLLSGCASMIAFQFTDPVQQTIERQEDLDLLYHGLPSLLLLQESMLLDQPDSSSLLQTAVRGESSYAELLKTYGETDRARQHAQKGAAYACRLMSLSLSLPHSCSADLKDFNASLQQAGSAAVGPLFWSASALGTSMRLEQGSSRSMILIPRILAIMNRLLQLDAAYYYGGPHLFLGYYYGSLPVMLGGRPEESRRHFEEALRLGKRKFLLAQVFYAESYARQTLNRQLFEDLLKEVLSANIEIPELGAVNALARRKAESLLKQEDQLF